MPPRSSRSYDIQWHIVNVLSGIPSEHLDALLASIVPLAYKATTQRDREESRRLVAIVEQATHLSDQQEPLRQ